MENKTKEISQNEEDIEEFEEPLAQPGKLFLAEIHGSAQRFLKIKKLSKYIRSCKCCLLPSETPGVVVPYTCLDNKEDFGIGIQLYFFYIQFCIVVCFTVIVLCSIPSMIFSKYYYDDLNKHCDNYFFIPGISNLTVKEIYNPVFNTTTEHCYQYLSLVLLIIRLNSDSSAMSTEWITKFSSEHIINYYKVFKEKASDTGIITDTIFNYSFVYFLAAITLLIINFFFIHYANLIDDKENFGSTTPRDFTLLIRGVKRPDKKTSKTQHLNNIISEISRDYFDIQIHQIIPCYNLVELFKLSRDVLEDKIKIYHAYNFQRQKNLHKEYIKQNPLKRENFNSYDYYKNEIIKLKADNSYINQNIDNEKVANNNSSQILQMKTQSQFDASLEQPNENNNKIFLHDNNMNYYSKFLWKIKATPLNKIESRIVEKNKKIQQIEKDLAENPDKYSSGIFFVVFKYMKMQEQFYDFYPTHYISRALWNIKYFFQNIIFGNCVSEKTKRKNYLKTEIKVQYATEAYEVFWQNMGYTSCQKVCYFLFSLSVTLILILISFAIVYFLNSIQFDLTDSEGQHTFLEYFLSFIISIIISEINSLSRRLLKLVTRHFEANETKTNYYISLSVKITIFTFLNTSIVPLISNFLQRELKINNILLNNLFMIFLTNFTLRPIVFYLNPNLLVKLTRRARAIKALEGIPVKESTYTQDELNRLFQNPSMSICNKYSFYSNVVLTTLFYMTLFPLGAVFSFVGLLLSYFLEIVHLGFYKRPEILNSNLCKFFIYHFKFAVAVFAVGNYVFLSDAETHFDINWPLINLILFIVIAIIPYDAIKFNLLGVSEGEMTKGSYDEYKLIFPTDYEKQNPLTKKEAMIKYFDRLRQNNTLNNIQYNFLVDKVKKENPMINYYKISKNVGNVFHYFEFQNQFAKIKRKRKFFQEKKNAKRALDNYTIYVNQKAKERRKFLGITDNLKNTGNKSGLNNVNNFLNIMNTSMNINNLNANENNKTKGLAEYNPRLKRKISNYMRQSLYHDIKDMGVYSETEDENEDYSIKTEDISEEINKNKSKEN